MIFDYNPITGLIYKPLDDSFLIIDMELIPSEKSTAELLEEWAKFVKEIGISIINSKPEPVTKIFYPIMSNVFYEDLNEIL